MDRFIESVIQSDAFGITILVFAFLCGATLFYLSYNFLIPSLDIRRRIGSADPIGREAIRLVSAGQSGVQNRVRQAIETYYRSLEEKKQTSYRRRLIRAGFFGEGAVRALPLIR